MPFDRLWLSEGTTLRTQKDTMKSASVIKFRMSLDIPLNEPSCRPKGTDWPDFCGQQHPEQAWFLLNEAYASGGGTIEPFGEWWPKLAADSEFDPKLCFVAIDRETSRLIGFAQCWTSGFVKDLAVAAPWRRMGLGTALLRAAFREFKSRGAHFVDLKVEASNPHGAVSFYRRLGMTAVTG